MVWRLLVVWLTVLLALTTSTARAYEPHVLRYNYGYEGFVQLNPFLNTRSPVESLSELTAAELVRFDGHGHAIPELAITVPTQANGGISRDGLTITWHLRHGLRWSDGVALTAEDAVYTFRVAADPANNIVSRGPWQKLAATMAPDPYTLVFRFKTPYALFLNDYFSTLSATCILPKHLLGPGTEINDAPYNALPVGAGPFRYAAFHRGDDVELESNPYYWRGHAKLQRIVCKMITNQDTLLTQLQTGELDLWQNISGRLVPRVSTLPGKASATTFGDTLNGIYFNLTQPAVADRQVREALRYATDQRTVVDKIFLGNGALQRSLVGSIVPDYLPLPLLQYNLTRAAAMLDAAGWRVGPSGTRAKNGVSLTIDLAITAGSAQSVSMASVLREDWGRIGVQTTIHSWADALMFGPVEAGGVLAGGKFDAALIRGPAGALYIDVRRNLTCATIPPHGYNFTRYCNSALDALNDRYEKSFDPKERKRIGAAMQRILDHDVPAIVIYQPRELSAFDARLRGFNPSPFSYWGDPLKLDI